MPKIKIVVGWTLCAEQIRQVLVERTFCFRFASGRNSTKDGFPQSRDSVTYAERRANMMTIR
jgi:hypothetical protein